MKAVLSAAILFSLVLYSCEDDLINPDEGDERVNVEGSWKCIESSELFGEYTYYLNIYLNEQDSSVIDINNFYQLGSSIDAQAIMNGRNLLIFEQTLQGGFTVSGTGVISSDYDEIELSYSVTQVPAKGIMSDQVSANLTKQY